MGELEQLQNEKRKMLMEHETQKLRELDDMYGQELREWKAQLKPRKQTLEDDFAFQLEEQERHYGPYLNSALSAEAAAAEGRNSATPTDGRRGSQPSRKASSKSSGSERSPEAEVVNRQSMKPQNFITIDIVEAICIVANVD